MDSRTNPMIYSLRQLKFCHVLNLPGIAMKPTWWLVQFVLEFKKNWIRVYMSHASCIKYNMTLIRAYSRQWWHRRVFETGTMFEKSAFYSLEFPKQMSSLSISDDFFRTQSIKFHAIFAANKRTEQALRKTK